MNLKLKLLIDWLTENYNYNYPDPPLIIKVIICPRHEAKDSLYKWYKNKTAETNLFRPFKLRSDSDNLIDCLISCQFSVF